MRSDLRELRAIARSWQALRREGKRAVLITLVATEGASYRRPGARMLADEEGFTHGHISGGCLEGDLATHAQRVLSSGVPLLLSYDLSESDEVAWGLNMGCPGTLQVILEPFEGERAEQFCAVAEGSGPLVVGIIYRTSASGGEGEPGGSWALLPDGILQVYGGAEISDEVLRDISTRALEGEQGIVPVTEAPEETRALVEVLAEPRRLCILGAGPDTSHLLRIVDGLGWSTEVVDPRSAPPGLELFPQATRVVRAEPVEIVEDLSLDASTAVVLTSHNFPRDVELLRRLARLPVGYVGLLGSRGRRASLLEKLAGEEVAMLGERLHAPVGLDIGAESPAEIALSIAAELQAVMVGRRGGSLRDAEGPIHG